MIWPRLQLRMQEENTYTWLMNELRHGLSADHYKAWEKRLRQLDERSLQQILERIAPLSGSHNRSEIRMWRPLFDTLNETRGYQLLRTLEYSSVSFIPRSESKRQLKTPDLYGIAAFGEALCEVKTLNLSHKDIARFGKSRDAFHGLPEGLKCKIKTNYSQACKQLHSPLVRLQGRSVRRICYFWLNLDLSFQLASSNEKLLNEYLKSIEKECEIFHAAKWTEDAI